MGDLEKLSSRQREILELLAKGLTNAEIGSVLGISPTTVRTHVTAILATLDVTNRTEAAMRYAECASRADRVETVLRAPALAVLPFEPVDDVKLDDGMDDAIDDLVDG